MNKKKTENTNTNNKLGQNSPSWILNNQRANTTLHKQIKQYSNYFLGARQGAVFLLSAGAARRDWVYRRPTAPREKVFKMAAAKEQINVSLLFLDVSKHFKSGNFQEAQKVASKSMYIFHFETFSILFFWRLLLFKRR